MFAVKSYIFHNNLPPCYITNELFDHDCLFANLTKQPAVQSLLHNYSYENSQKLCKFNKYELQ